MPICVIRLDSICKEEDKDMLICVEPTECVDDNPGFKVCKVKTGELCKYGALN